MEEKGEVLPRCWETEAQIDYLLRKSSREAEEHSHLLVRAQADMQMARPWADQGRILHRILPQSFCSSCVASGDK